MENNGRGSPLSVLSDDLLLHIFGLVEQQERVALLPRVCQRWHQLLGTPGVAWAEVEWTATLTTPASVARCHAFLRWLAPRCGLLRRLSFVVERTHADVWLTRATVATLQLILRSAAASLVYLKLVLPCPVELELWLQAPAPALEALLVGAHSVSVGPSMAERMRALRHLELFTPEDEGPPTFEPGVRLPPGLTRLVLVPGRPRLPECVLELQHLGYLDIGAGAYEEGALDAAFARLTSIHTLALDRSAILAVPQGLSCLTNLRVLSMHQALVSLDGGHVDVASFSALAPLRQLTTLSISGCSLGDVPPALIQLTQLRTFHTEGALMRLAPGPYLRSLLLLSVDWQVLFRDPGVLLGEGGLSSLRRLCISLATTFGMLPLWQDLASMRSAAEVLGAIGRHPTLSSVVLVVNEGDLGLITLRLTEFLLGLARCRPGLDVSIVPASRFFLTDGVGAGADLLPIS